MASPPHLHQLKTVLIDSNSAIPEDSPLGTEALGEIDFTTDLSWSRRAAVSNVRPTQSCNIC